MTMVIVAGGIDLSVGSIVALTTVVIALLLGAGYGPIAAAAGGVGAGAICGFVSGLLVTRLRVVPFIVTLGMMLLVRGTAKGLSGERRLEAPATWLNDLLRTLEPGRGLPRARRHLAGRAAGTRRRDHAAVHALRPPPVLDRIERANGAAVRRGRRSHEGCGVHDRRRVDRRRGRSAVLAALGRRPDGGRRPGARRDRRRDHRRRQPCPAGAAPYPERSSAPPRWPSSRSGARSEACRTGCSRSSRARSSCWPWRSIGGGRRDDGAQGSGLRAQGSRAQGSGLRALGSRLELCASSSPRVQGIYQRCQTGAEMCVAGLQTLRSPQPREVQPRAQVAEVTGLGSGSGSDVEKMQILALGTARRSFNNIGCRGDRGLAELALQSVPLGRGKIRRCSINIDYQAISQREHPELSMISAHDRLDARPSRTLPRPRLKPARALSPEPEPRA